MNTNHGRRRFLALGAMLAGESGYVTVDVAHEEPWASLRSAGEG